MLGIFDDVLDGVSNLASSAANTVGEFVEDPIGKTVEVATQPLRDGVEIVEGLTEGELRIKAIASLGADAVSGMAAGELVEWYSNMS